MNFIKNIIKKLTPKNISTPLGRWRIDNCKAQVNRKIDLSNEDHCGPCGEYLLEKVKIKNDVNINTRSDKLK
jgi:hypothetical protein